MPNTSITIYLSDEDYVKYVKKKTQINEKLRIFIKELL